MDIPKVCKRFGTTITYTIGTITLIILLGLGIASFTYTSNAVRTSNYKRTTCILTQSSVITSNGFNCLHTKYIAVWRTSTGYSALISPLSSSSTQSVATGETNDYPLNTSIECYCDEGDNIQYPNVDGDVPCMFYGRCFLSKSVVSFMSNQTYFHNVGIFLIVFSVFGLGVVIGLGIIACIGSKWCRKHGCKCCRRDEYVDLDN